MTTFDFDDDNCPVPAHQHGRGGGWVADTAKVADTAYIGPDAKVFGYAQVYDDALAILSELSDKRGETE